MGTLIASSAYATRPSLISLAFLEAWLPGAFEDREAQAPLERTNTVYIAQGATAGTGTELDPYLRANATDLKTLMDSLYSSIPGPLRIRLKTGDQWYRASGAAVNVTRANVTIDYYGTGAPPVFHGTETLASLGVASMGSPSGGIYTVTLGSSEMSGKSLAAVLPDWGSDPTVLAEWDLSDPGLAVSVSRVAPFAETTAVGRTKTYKRRATSGAVAGQGEYHYNSGTRVLTIFPHTGATITTAAIRAVTHIGGGSFTGMIQVQDVDSVRIEGIAVIGTSGNGNSASDQVWGIISAVAGSNATVVKSCLLLYCGFHTAGQYNGSAVNTGGQFIIIDTVMGLGKHYEEIPLIYYAFAGGQECWSRGNTLLGFVPDDNHSTVRERGSQVIYGHTNGGGIRTGVFYSWGDRSWSGQYGHGGRPYVSPPLNDANPDDGTNNTIDTAGSVIVGFEMDFGGYPTRKNAGNAIRMRAAQSGHAYLNCWYHSIYWKRTTDTATVEWAEISTTDYDYRGWNVNAWTEVNVAAQIGADNFGFGRNNLGTGTEPDMAGVDESFNFYCGLILRVPAALSVTGNWNRLAFDQSGNIFTSGGSSGNTGPCTNRASWFNCLIICDSLANSSEDIVLGIPKADAGRSAGSGLRYAAPSGQTVRGGASRCMFYRTSSADITNGTGQMFGTGWHVTNAACFAAASFTTPGQIPAAGSPEVIPAHFPLAAVGSVARLQYDFLSRPRNNNASVESDTTSEVAAIGPVEMMLPSDQHFGGTGGPMRDLLHLRL